MALTKTEVIRMISEKTGVQGKQVSEVLAQLAEIAISETKQSGEFTVPGLGKLVKSERAARVGRNPATGESIQIAAKTAIKFRFAKAASDAIAATV